MSVATSTYVQQIGETAGTIWHVLDESGPQSMTRLSKLVEAPPNVIMHAIGWLAREGKIEVDENGRSRTVSLR